MRLSQTIVFAKDMARMVAFYGDALGLPILEGTPEDGWVKFDAGGCALALHAIPPAIAARIDIQDPPRARGDTPIKLAFHVDDVDAARENLVARGVPMQEVRRRDATALCDGLDPEGNVFQITSH
jgi:catechol 2,3-dioxygenase-like lactoylglutathione lyase family enzyme